MTRLELKIPPVVVFLIVGVIMWGVARTVPVANFYLPAGMAISVALTVVGLALGVTGILAFVRKGTTFHPRSPEKASAVVTNGIYRFTRNPMYLGLAFLLTAWATKLGSLLALACVPLFIAYMTRFQIKPEERALLSLFGAPYDDYMKSVRRWL